MRAKFRCNNLMQSGTATQAQLSAVVDDGTEENARYHQYTPFGALTLSIDNPNLVGFFEVGKSYYLDFAEASEA
jgi:hypothetical protein